MLIYCWPAIANTMKENFHILGIMLGLPLPNFDSVDHNC